MGGDSPPSTPTRAAAECTHSTPLLANCAAFLGMGASAINSHVNALVSLPLLYSPGTMRTIASAVFLLGSVMACRAAAFLPPFAGGAVNR